MGVKDVFGKIGGFITGVVPSILKLGEAVNLLLSLITVKVATKDLPALQEAAVLGQELGELFIEFGQELAEFFIKLGEAAADGALDGSEIKMLADEGDDILPIAAEFPGKVAALMAKIRSLF